uniref:ATP synthase F0 subunit 8 n=1 Tax=Sorineuchora formosana TaxID=3037028 RepID=UPI002798E228|nr:ATP synthase F0 subunit 8 [Sorineuchora formosana]WGO57642.1 ATP synthase F0 subunit 8 [Sorineuchora formosana]
MPQMMPLSWLTLYLFFIIVFILFNTINFFINMPKINKTPSMKNIKKSLNWKW